MRVGLRGCRDDLAHPRGVSKNHFAPDVRNHRVLPDGYRSIPALFQLLSCASLVPIFPKRCGLMKVIVMTLEPTSMTSNVCLSAAAEAGSAEGTRKRSLRAVRCMGLLAPLAFTHETEITMTGTFHDGLRAL